MKLASLMRRLFVLWDFEFVKLIETQPSNFQHKKKNRNKIINLINLAWKRGFVEDIGLWPFLRLRHNFFFFCFAVENMFSSYEPVGSHHYGINFSTFHISYRSKIRRFSFSRISHFFPIFQICLPQQPRSSKKSVVKIWNEIKLNFLFSTGFGFSFISLRLLSRDFLIKCIVRS